LKVVGKLKYIILAKVVVTPATPELGVIHLQNNGIDNE